jgi:hypothetical protein
MKKVKLDLEALDVQSFRTMDGARLSPGTIHARSEDGTTDTEDEVCRYRPTPDPYVTRLCNSEVCTKTCSPYQTPIIYCGGGF